MARRKPVVTDDNDVETDTTNWNHGIGRPPAPSFTKPPVAQTYMYAINPAGVPVTFVPGETLPDWYLAQVAEEE